MPTNTDTRNTTAQQKIERIFSFLTEAGGGLEGGLDLLIVVRLFRPVLQVRGRHRIGHAQARRSCNAVLEKSRSASAPLGDRLAAPVGAGNQASLPRHDKTWHRRWIERNHLND